MKKKQKNTKKVDVFAMMVKHMNEKTPVKQNSGRGLVPDSTVEEYRIYMVVIRKLMNEHHNHSV